MLYRTWWSHVSEKAQRLVGSEEEARDVAQQIFARLWESGDWRGIDDPDRFFTRAARNEVLTRLRRRRRRQTFPLTDAMVAVLRHHGDSPEKALIRSERRDVCLHREVADALGISMGAVEKQVARGRRLIRDMVKEGECGVSGGG